MAELFPLPDNPALLAQRAWFRQYTTMTGFEYPADYTCFDVETDGTNTDECLVCLIGHTVVRDRQPVESTWRALKWTQHPDIEQDDFRVRLRNTEAAMRRKGASFYHTWDFLEQYGMDPAEILGWYMDMVKDCHERGEMIVAHNGWKFDAEMLQQNWHNYLHESYRIPEDMLYDSGIMEKASKLEDRDHPLPYNDETKRDWSLRIGALRRKGIFWAMEPFCLEHYKLLDNTELTVRDLHLPHNDSWTLARLVEAHRAMAAPGG